MCLPLTSLALAELMIDFFRWFWVFGVVDGSDASDVEDEGVLGVGFGGGLLGMGGDGMGVMGWGWGRGGEGGEGRGGEGRGGEGRDGKGRGGEGRGGKKNDIEGRDMGV